MNSQLAEHLPLRKYLSETIACGTELHHFGKFDASKHQLDRPIWVSDTFECALAYKTFGVAAPRYTKFITKFSIDIINLNGVHLQKIAEKLEIYNHSDWNKCLAAHLVTNNILGIVYAGRELFLPQPNAVIKETCSQSC